MSPRRHQADLTAAEARECGIECDEEDLRTLRRLTISQHIVIRALLEHAYRNGLDAGSADAVARLRILGTDRPIV